MNAQQLKQIEDNIQNFDLQFKDDCKWHQLDTFEKIQKLLSKLSESQQQLDNVKRRCSRCWK